MEQVRVGIIMNGVTGRMGANQHLARSIVAIREEGGVSLGDGRVIWPDPVLVGRSEDKLRALAQRHKIERWTTDLAAALADERDAVYFDAQITARRVEAVRAAIAAGKAVYCEKPVATDLPTAVDLARQATAAGVRNGVVADKLFLPGLRKLARLVDGGFFGRILSVKLDFGYWVFEGDWQPVNRPSWNYRTEEGGGVILDMYAHWRYILDSLLGPVRSVLCLGATHIPRRVDERGVAYQATADDAAYGLFTFDSGVVAQTSTSWCTRPYRDELIEIQVDGTHGSAVAGLRDCRIQHRAQTPKPVWNPDIPNPIDFRAGWAEVPDNEVFGNAFRVQWERFLRHVVDGEPFPWDLLEGAKGVQLAALARRSWDERRWVDVPELTVPELTVPESTVPESTLPESTVPS